MSVRIAGSGCPAGSTPWPARRYPGPKRPRSPGPRRGLRSGCVISPTTSTLRGFQACGRAETPGQRQPLSDGVGATILQSRRFTSMVNIRPIGPWPSTDHQFPGLRIALHNRLQAGIHRLDQAGAFKGDAIGNLLDAAAYNPIHDAHVLRESAAGGLESGCDAHSLVVRTARIACARSRNSRGRECGETPPRGRRLHSLRRRLQPRPPRRPSRGRKSAAAAADRTRSSSDPCGRCRSFPRGPESLPGRSPAPRRLPPTPIRDPGKQRPSSWMLPLN